MSQRGASALRALSIGLLVLGSLIAHAASAEAASQRSANVAVIEGEGAGSVGTLQTSGVVAGASKTPSKGSPSAL